MLAYDEMGAGNAKSRGYPEFGSSGRSRPPDLSTVYFLPFSDGPPALYYNSTPVLQHIYYDRCLIVDDNPL
jgi:hypothetical protein